MNFKEFNSKIQNQFKKMCSDKMLFVSQVDGRNVWDTYLNSFEVKRKFRDPESSEHNCNCCKNFLRRYGNIVAIDDDLKITTLFSDLGDCGEYTASAVACDKLLKSKPIGDVFFETYDMLKYGLNYEKVNKTQQTYRLGVASNLKRYTVPEAQMYGVVQAGKIYEFNHFNIDLPREFVSFDSRSIEQIKANYRAKYSVHKRCMEEIPLDTLLLVKDLINQGSLLNGDTFLGALKAVATIKIQFDREDAEDRDNSCWLVAHRSDGTLTGFKNTLMGVLCTEIAEGMDLNKACLNWNKRVDPANYHKAKAPITKKQIEAAKKYVEDNDYSGSFNRTLATIDDIKASEILHMNTADKPIKEVSIFDNVKATKSRYRRSEFNNIEEVSIDKFMKDILPSCSSVEVYLENRMQGNLVTMTKSVDNDSKRITKWGGLSSNYSWTFNGNLAGKSQIKQAVKKAGGDTNGVLNFRLAWNDIDGKDNSDLDAWALDPENRIGFSSPYVRNRNNRSMCSGQLDADNTDPRGKLAVENITWNDISKMKDGEYILWVNQYSARNSQGFKAEIEFNGEIYSYSYEKRLSTDQNVKVAIVTLKDGEFSIKHLLPQQSSNKEMWGLETNNFYKADLICKSPNHWGDNNVGNLHYFFMLNGCKAKGDIRTFHNENLIPELLQHRKVLEVLGNQTMINPVGPQLSGVGFNSTVRDEVIVKCSGNFKRVLKIKF